MLSNKRLEIIIQQEQNLKNEKNQLENLALSTISDDLQSQLEEMKESAEKITGRITPFGME